MVLHQVTWKATSGFHLNVSLEQLERSVLQKVAVVKLIFLDLAEQVFNPLKRDVTCALNNYFIVLSAIELTDCSSTFMPFYICASVSSWSKYKYERIRFLLLNTKQYKC